MDYRVTKTGGLDGLWLRLRGAPVQGGGRATEKDVRLSLDHEFPHSSESP